MPSSTSSEFRRAIIPNVVDSSGSGSGIAITLRPRLVSTRNLDPLYNVACTLQAFRVVQDRWPDASLTLVGGGPCESALRGLAADLKLRNVTFVGQVQPDEMARYYASNDIYIQSPNIDNMPSSVLEAYASGLPVVSTAAGGVPAILTHGEDGLLAGLDDYEGLAAHVLHLLDNPAFAHRMARAAHSRCQACTWLSVRKQWLAAYRSLLARPESVRTDGTIEQNAVSAGPTRTSTATRL